MVMVTKFVSLTMKQRTYYVADTLYWRLLKRISRRNDYVITDINTIGVATLVQVLSIFLTEDLSTMMIDAMLSTMMIGGTFWFCRWRSDKIRLRPWERIYLYFTNVNKKGLGQFYFTPVLSRTVTLTFLQPLLSYSCHKVK